MCNQPPRLIQTTGPTHAWEAMGMVEAMVMGGILIQPLPRTTSRGRVGDSVETLDV